MISREKTSNLIKLAILVLINLCIICFAFYQVPSSALASTQPSDQPSVDAISQYGSQSDEVTKIQTRLKAWGYFDGPVTGYYGSQTTEAVKAFQQKHGLSATGVADLVDQIDSLRYIRPDIRVAGVLVNQWHRSPVVEDAASYLREDGRVPVYDTVIRRTDKVPESSWARMAVQQWSPFCSAARDYRAWVAELAAKEGIRYGQA